MLLLVAGLLLFMVPHLLPTAPDMRASLRDKMGASGYLLAFSIVSLASLIMIATGYGEAHGRGVGNVQLWYPPAFMKHITMLLMLPAFILLAAAYIPSRIRTAAKHPMLAAVKLWALGHLLVRGDLASLLLFGSFLAYGVFDRISVKQRSSLGPLGTATGGLKGDIMAVAVGGAAYVLMLLYGHAYLIGVPLVRTSFAP
jgi:uncharacterized membrane protein